MTDPTIFFVEIFGYSKKIFAKLANKFHQRSTTIDLSCLKKSCMRIITSLKRIIFRNQNADNATKQIRKILETA